MEFFSLELVSVTRGPTRIFAPPLKFEKLYIWKCFESRSAPSMYGTSVRPPVGKYIAARDRSEAELARSWLCLGRATASARGGGTDDAQPPRNTSP
eukprot:scaffold3725_cov129-Isochrysis_galbana.AAC.5